jgi:FAD-linked oxidoreductase
MAQWRNWSGSVEAHPSAIARPRTEAELARLVAEASAVRVVGAGHSFMPLCATDGLLLNLSDLEGELVVAPDRRTVDAPAGWSLARLTEALWAQGLSLPNQGDVNPQSVAGAVSTGTHGTGKDLGSLAAMARGFRIVTAGGEALDCDAITRPDLYAAARVSLGLLGVVTRITMEVMPAYHLEETVERWPLAEVVERFDDWAAERRHVEFFVFPYADEVILKTLRPAAPEGELRASQDIGETAFRLACETGARLPATIPGGQRLMMKAMGKPTRRVGPAWRIFPSDRTVPFEEMEYEVPRDAGLETLKAAIDHIRKARLPVTFPFEFRWVAGDDIWLSPFHAGPCASISMHQFAPMGYAEVFAAVEPILRASGGRPHWAKRHTLGEADAHALYPRLADFLAVRRAVDPDAKFANPLLRSLFGIAPETTPDTPKVASHG